MFDCISPKIFMPNAISLKGKYYYLYELYEFSQQINREMGVLIEENG
jgi:hypothetical protein